MSNKKIKHMESQHSRKKSNMTRKSSKDFDEAPDLKDEHEIEEMLEEEMHGDLDEEDDEEFIHQVKEFEKEHSKSKMINIFNKIGKPKFPVLKKLDPKCIKDELKRLFLVLDKYNIIVHFHNDYPEKERYRFITEEIFREFVEDDKKHHHIAFVYEDYHPEMDDEDDDDENF